MAPTIRTVARYSTHSEYSIDFFGDELIVTVTRTAFVISQWIYDVIFNNSHSSSHPLVVGVGVQWSPFSYTSDAPVNGYYADPPPYNYYDDPPPYYYYPDPQPRYYDYYVDPPSNNHYADLLSNHYYADPPSIDPQLARYDADLPQNDRYADPPRNSYYTDPSPGDYSPDGPSGSYYSDPQADTLQLCVGNQILIIQLSYCNQIPNELRRFLADSETKFVGIWNSQDAGKLARSRHRLVIDGELHDIREYVIDSEGRSLRRCSFEEIVEECLGYEGVKLDPDISMSDWSVNSLYHDQILQASLDVYVCSKLGVRVRIWEH